MKGAGDDPVLAQDAGRAADAVNAGGLTAGNLSVRVSAVGGLRLFGSSGPATACVARRAVFTDPLPPGGDRRRGADRPGVERIGTYLCFATSPLCRKTRVVERLATAVFRLKAA